mgnify:CR=1 FL=1
MGGQAHGAVRRLAHLLLVVLGWVGFVWMWTLVASRPWDSRGLVWLITGSLIVVPLLTGLVGWCPPYSLLGWNTCSVK